MTYEPPKILDGHETAAWVYRMMNGPASRTARVAFGVCMIDPDFPLVFRFPANYSDWRGVYGTTVKP